MPLNSFSRGDIIWWDFPPSPVQPDYTLNGRHMAVILSDDSLPNRTVIVSPISSWVKKDENGKIITDESGNEVHKELQATFQLGLHRKDYPEVLIHDSYIKLDQIYTLTRDAIDGTVVGRVNADDQFQMDMRLMIVLQMFETLKKIVEYNVNRSSASASQS